MDHYVIYERPDDFPEGFLVRHWRIGPGIVSAGEVLGTAGSLDEARDLVPPWADALFPRALTDSPAIVETWI